VIHVSAGGSVNRADDSAKDAQGVSRNHWIVKFAETRSQRNRPIERILLHRVGALNTFFLLASETGAEYKYE
jgi:hypothetical protein